ncbi:multicopper oxidase family protein [Actinocrispum wychmicini]|uniref:FtsP/CotA-like multicopper oxidase with cupredoxin domain n=1 Tax=Actinocrispum wychmicini TaxID=1213861 RepID=A0A4R2J429_9PSEU|nr:multicopper oxidase domain-containing protein [Actinocrispum wychmicini]TCO52844.1 FtsP/CotA-like multicopper oxidase with cupredoxin domain [Actinocrispum wychmicini]
MLNRRGTLKLGAVAGVALALPAERLVSAVVGSPPAVQPFTTPLPIPPVLSPVYSDRGTDYYEMTAKPANVEILPGTRTNMLTFNGSFPGPTIKARQGRPVQVKILNGLDNVTAVHLHGGNVPHEDDGHPLDVLQPGQTRTYHYPNIQRAATLWYHDHAHHLEAEQIYRGLAGLYLIEDRTDSPTLPRGQFDIPLMFRDIALDDSAQLLWNNNDSARRNIVLTNGKAQPKLRVRRRRYRFRLLNASNDRVMSFRLSNGAEMVQIASDGGLMARPVRRTEIGLYPAERVDVVVDFSALPGGTQLVLQNTVGDTPATKDVLQFEVAGGARRDDDDSSVPAKLSVLPPIGAPVMQTRKVLLSFDFKQGAFLINGKQYDPNRVDFTVKKGSTEIWEITNADPDPFAHSLHVHQIQFRVLDRGGKAVEPWEAYPKDTVSVPSGQTVRILIKFDSPFTGLYPFHCHFVGHSSMAMMAQFNIVP